MDAIKAHKQREFAILHGQIIAACENAPNRVSQCARDYLVHKIARKIKTFKDDIHAIEIDSRPFNESGGYYSYFSVEAYECTLYVRITID